MRLFVKLQKSVLCSSAYSQAPNEQYIFLHNKIIKHHYIPFFCLVFNKGDDWFDCGCRILAVDKLVVAVKLLL